jgi:chromosome segregation ATPase
MTRLDDALARFSAALDRLENRVEEANARGQEAGDSPAEISLLKAERERMCARIGELEEESRALAGLTGEVEERLDGAIAEIREVLSRN